MKRILSVVIVLAMALTSILAIVPVPAAAAENTFDASNYKETTEFTISTVADLEAFAQDTRLLGHDYFGKVVKLANDIEINDITKDEWWKEVTGVYTPVSVTSICGYTIVKKENPGEWGFRGTFDGQGHTLTGFIGKPANDKEEEGYAGGLFRRINGTNYGSAQIKNLTIDGFYSASTSANNRQGVLVDEVLSGGLIENCTIKNAVLDVNNYDDEKCGTGLIAGYAYCDSWLPPLLFDFDGHRTEFTLQIINTTVENNCKINYVNKKPSDEVKAGVGGLVGHFWGEGTLKFKIELSGSAINFEGVSEVSPLGSLDEKNQELDFVTIVNGVEKSRGLDLAKANTELKNSGSYGVASNSKYTLPEHTEHEWQEVAQEDPTCRKTGIAAGKVCLVCELKEGFDLLAKLEHNYGSNGKCTFCNTRNPAATTEKPTTPTTPDAGTTAGGNSGSNSTTAPTTEAPASSGCGGFSGIGVIAAFAVSIVSVFGLALIVKKR